MLYSAKLPEHAASAQSADGPAQPAGQEAPAGREGTDESVSAWEVWIDARQRYRARPVGGTSVPGLIARNRGELREQLREAALRALL